MNSLFFNNKRVLITGGLGFIGSNLAKRLINAGAQVTLVDALIPEYGGNVFNIEAIKDKVEVIIADVRDTKKMTEVIKGKEYLFNLAGQTSHLDSMHDPITDLEINSKAQLSILEVCRQSNPEIKIVFASTRQVYGRPQYLPVDEKHPLKAVDVNGINKLAGEQYHILYNDVYQIRSSVLRLTNTYGPGMRIKDIRQTFLGIWIKNLVEGRPFEVWGGSQLRDFNHVDDVVEAFLIATSNDKACGQVYNLGHNEIISLVDLAKILVSITHGEYLIKEFPNERKKIDIGDYYSDFNLINKELGWKPTVNLNAGLIRTIDYYQANLRPYIS